VTTPFNNAIGSAPIQSESELHYNWQSVSKSWCRAQIGTFDQRSIFFFLSQSQSYITTDSQSVSKSWCRAQSGTFDQRSIFFFKFLSCHLGAPSLTRGRVCHLSVYSQSTVVSQYLHKIFTYCVTHIWQLQYSFCVRHIYKHLQALRSRLCPSYNLWRLSLI
jgi:hypothetical protein